MQKRGLAKANELQIKISTIEDLESHLPTSVSLSVARRSNGYDYSKKLPAEIQKCVQTFIKERLAEEKHRLKLEFDNL